MCGRYARYSDKQRIAEHFQTSESVFDIHPNYNVAPATMQPVIRLNADTSAREIVMMRWGLIPGWYKDPRHLGLSTINAKAETLMEKPMWRQPFKKRRVLVPADAFFEWKKIDAKTKQPHAFALKDNAMMALAGVWERWNAPDGKPVDTFAIITTEPNELAARVHNRMPVLLKTQDYARWLTGADQEPPPIDLLRPYDARAMRVWRVGREVGNVRNNGPELLAEISPST